jgi:hypothetical protein
MKTTPLAALAVILGLASAMPARAAVVLIDSYDNALAPDGYYSLAYPFHYSAGELRGPGGSKLADADFSLDVVFLRAVAYKHVGKLPLAFQVILPVGRLQESTLADVKSSGLGDTIFGPGAFLYANEAMGTTISYWLYLYAPTGKYASSQAPFNLGTNHWYFEHQLAFNQVIQKRIVLDANLNFYHHTEDRDLNTTAPLRFELAAIAAYQVTDQLLIGVHGGAYWDLGDVEVNGVSTPDTAASAVALGPALSYQWTPKLGTTLRYTRDVSATNDFVGNGFWLRMSYAF